LLAAETTPPYKVVSRSPAASKLPQTHRGEVIRCHSERAIDPSTERVDRGIVGRMLSEGMRSLTGAGDDRAAWRAFFSPDDVVGIKVNCSGAPHIMSSPDVVAAIAQNLIATGIAPDHIYVYERFLDQLTSVHYEKFVPEGVQIVAVENPRGSLRGYDPAAYVEVDFFGEEDTRSNLVRLVTERFTKIINVPNMKEHRASGVTGCLKNIAYGNFSNVARSHRSEKTNTLSFIGTLAAVEPLRSKTVLNVMDGLRGVWHGGPFSTEKRFRFYPKQILLGTDPVAMDRMLLDVIEEKRKAEGALSIWDRSMTNIDRRTNSNIRTNQFIREPGHIEYAAKLGLGEYDMSRIRVKAVDL
jgi:uncharacterized protein (DUF362 family)